MSRNRGVVCPCCDQIRIIALYKPGSSVCKVCTAGVFRAAGHEYVTPWDMRLAAAMSRVRLTRMGLMSAMLSARVRAA